MSRPLLTYKLASAAGLDAGNASMRKAGRSKWDVEDFNVAARVTNQLIDIIKVEKPLKKSVE